MDGLRPLACVTHWRLSRCRYRDGPKLWNSGRLVHILIVTPFYPPDVSGAGRYVADIADTAAREGHRITVLHLGGRGERRTVANGTVVEPVTAARRGMTSFAAVRRALAIHGHEPIDLAVAGLAHPAGAPVALISRRARVPMLVIGLSEEFAPAYRSRLTSRILKFTLSSSRHVIAVSSWTKDNVVKLGGRPEACTIIPPALDAADYIAGANPESRALARQRFGVSGRVVLTVARLEERKGHDTVLRALSTLGSEFADVRYLVVGEGDQTVLRELATSLHLGDRLTILSSLTRTELIDAYAAADVFTMVSRPGPLGEVEGFGIVYLEAAACGLPCVAGNLGGCTDAVEHQTTGLLVDPTDSGAVAEGLRELLSNPDYRARLGAQGRSRVCERFSRTRFDADVLQVLEAVSAPRPVIVDESL